MRQIFISHSTRDARIVAELRDHLVRAGFKPWFDPAPRPGQDWRFDIDDAIRAANALIVVVTPAAAESVYVTYEWALALASGVLVIPIFFKDANVHPRLRTLEHFDYSSWKDPAGFWDYFLRELKRILPAGPAAGAPPQQQAAPAVHPQPAGVQRPHYDRSVMPSQPGHWLVIRRGPDLNRMYLMQDATITIGRDAANTLAIDDPEVSRYHLRLTRMDEGGYAAEDLGSTNGTRVDGMRISGVHPLRSGAALMLGDAIIISYEVVS